MKPTLLVMAAGMGSRYGGVKQIDSVGQNNETLLDFATFDAKRAGFGKVVYIIRKDIEKDFRERFFNRVARNFDAEYVFQELNSLLTAEQITQAKNRKKPWGTIHAVMCARDAIKTPFAVINADDYYGRDAFVSMNAHLSTLSNTATEHAVVGYILANTMSKNGTVSRAICKVHNGYLDSMRENTKIGYADDGKILSQIDGGEIELTGKEFVSMNFFGFTPIAFDGFATYFNDFIVNNSTSEKAESLLPDGASYLVTSGLGKIKFFNSSEKWFGMTYPEDRALVKQEIAKKIAEKYYPDILWEK